MKLFSRNRWLIVTAIHFLTLFAFSEINTYLSPWGISILITGMLLSFSSLVLSHTQGALSLIPIAFYLDSRSPLPFGSSLIILIGLHYLVVGFRYQFHRESGGISMAVSDCQYCDPSALHFIRHRPLRKRGSQFSSNWIEPSLQQPGHRIIESILSLNLDSISGTIWD